MLGFPLGFISEPDHFVLPKGVLEAACVKVSLHVDQSRQSILCEILMFVSGNFFPLEFLFPSFFIVLSAFFIYLKHDSNKPHLQVSEQFFLCWSRS